MEQIKKTQRREIGQRIMFTGPSIRRSLDEYIRRRIAEIPDEVRVAQPNVQKIWKCDNPADFLYGYFVGRIEEGALRYLLKSTKTSLGIYSDPFELRAVIESHRKEIYEAVKRASSIS